MHDSKGKTVNRNLNLPPFSRHLGFGEGCESCSYFFDVHKSRLKCKFKAYWN